MPVWTTRNGDRPLIEVMFDWSMLPFAHVEIAVNALLTFGSSVE